jgi:putative ABC transport system permease protein
MNEDRLWAATVSLPARYRGNAPDQFWASALAESRKLPQVASVAITVNMSPPLSGFDHRTQVFPEGSTAKAFEDMRFSYRVVSANYFETLGIPMLSGGSFERPRRETRVVVLNQAAARLLWPNDDPIGKRVRYMGNPATVVGIIPTFKIASLAAEPTAQLYVPYTQDDSFNTSTLMLRENPDAPGLADAVRTLITNLEPEAFVEVSTMAGIRWKQLADERFRTVVLMTFAATALFLALVGIFGVVSYSAVQRTREIGLRVALGATRQNVVTLLLRQTVWPAVAGLVVGAGAAIAASGLLSTFLFGVSPTDPLTFAAAVVLLMLAALGAALLPALRVSRINPMVALRYE